MISPDSVIVKQFRNAEKINLSEFIKQIVSDNEQDITDIQRDQMRRGEAADGKIKPDYPPGYLNLKQSLPSYFGDGSPDLFLTGDFQKAMYIRFSGVKWEFDSKDSKTVKLLDKYGENIFELNPNSLQVAQEFVTPIFNKSIHEALNK